MKFGLFYELSVPRPWTRESERTVYENALEQVRLADELGFDQVWAVEHHFLEEYSHCPAPDLFLTACARSTKDGTPMSQIPLFASAGQTVLVNDVLGRITYTPDLVPEEVARAWFAELSEAVAWKTQRRRMYDREVDVPRLTANVRLGPDEGDVPDAIRVAAGKVVGVTGVTFNSVGLNFYRDGRDSVAPHNDHLDEIVGGFPIALLSLGATRRMTIRAKEPPRRALHVDLTAGSLLVMSYETQRHYTHGIPKTKEPVGARISLAFRVRPAPDGADQARVYGRELGRRR